MTVHNVAELAGVLLDEAVAKAEGLHIDGIRAGQCIVGETPLRYVFAPSSKWAQGGPIIEREGIAVRPSSRQDNWEASTSSSCGYFGLDSEPGCPVMFGPDALIATMRAYVASKFGETVEIDSLAPPDLSR